LASLRETLEAPIPRPLLWLGTPALGVVLILVFTFLGFPYSDLIPAVSREIERATGGEIRIAQIEPQITLGGPGFAFRDLRLLEVGDGPVELEWLKIRPAWSTSWLRGVPAFAIDLTGPVVAITGIVTRGDSYGFKGEIVLPDLAMLPLAAVHPLSLSGAMTATGDISSVAGEPTGNLVFAAEQGSAAHPSLPVALAFDALSGRVELGGETWLALEDIELKGPIISARAEGTVDRPGGNRSPLLDLDVQLEIANPGFRMALSGLGLRVDRDGRAAFNLGGTLENPVLR